jgi:hypothetical protein
MGPAGAARHSGAYQIGEAIGALLLAGRQALGPVDAEEDAVIPTITDRDRCPPPAA